MTCVTLKTDKAFRIGTPMRKASWTRRFAAGWGEWRVRTAAVGSLREPSTAMGRRCQ
jgi:hypothetical protein